jgi:hypothetical protein
VVARRLSPYINPAAKIRRKFMYRRLRLVLCALSIPAAILGIVQTAGAGTARAFAGSYQLSNVVESGDSVNVTMTLVLRNVESSDVRNGIVVVMDTQPQHSYLGSFATIKSLPHSGAVTVTETFTMPAAEYARWKTGHDPVLEFLVPNGEGTITEGIQAHRTTSPGAEIN